MDFSGVTKWATDTTGRVVPQSSFSLDDIEDWLGKHGNTIKDIGTLLYGGGSLYNAYNQSRYAKSLLDLQKAQLARGNRREDMAQQAMVNGFNQSGLSSQNKKKKQTGLVNLQGGSYGVV